MGDGSPARPLKHRDGDLVDRMTQASEPGWARPARRGKEIRTHDHVRIPGP
ncbi:hypothetical protein [Streptomyces sp. NPDC054783]